jgi:hypothetical protein
LAVSVVLTAGAAVEWAGTAAGAVAAGAVVAGGVEAGLVVAVRTFAGGVAAGGCVACGAAAAAGCSVAGWLARLRPRGPPAWACVASSDIAAIRISLRTETPVIWSIRLT